MADKPLSNLDYLIRGLGDPRLSAASAEGRPQHPVNSAAPLAMEAWIEEALVGLTTPILHALRDKPGTSSVFGLVDQLDIRVDQLRPVLDLIARRFGWIDVGKTDRKGDDTVTLTPRGRDYLDDPHKQLR